MREIFNEIVKELWPARIIDRCDATLIVVAAMHLATALDAHEMVVRLGTTYPVTRGAYNGQPGVQGPEANPAVKIMRDSLAEYRQCCDLLGIGPVGPRPPGEHGSQRCHAGASPPGHRRQTDAPLGREG